MCKTAAWKIVAYASFVASVLETEWCTEWLEYGLHVKRSAIVSQ